MNLQEEIKVLQELGKVKAELASEKRNQDSIKLWTKVNDLETERPALYINEEPWHEMNVNNELTMVCKDPFHRSIEDKLRREIYSYRHYPANQVITNTWDSEVVIKDSGFGIEEESDIVTLDADTTAPSRHFHIQIKGMEDIEKIKDPVISLDKARTIENLQRCDEIFSGILDVRKAGVRGYWFTPWDNLIRLTGVQEALMDLVLQPEYVDKLVERFVDASIVRMNRYKELGLWGSNNANVRVGSGGYGYSRAIAQAEGNDVGTPASEIWGCGNAQIFSEVSPQMHWDFSLKHEMRWLENHGLNYYGCCEPLSGKYDLLDKIPNLRKVSCSPWTNLDVAAERSKGKYVMSVKPNPAVFVGESLDEDFVRKDLRKTFDRTKGCSVELIMKDVSSVRYKPERLWRWAEIAMEEIDKYYK